MVKPNSGTQAHYPFRVGQLVIEFSERIKNTGITTEKVLRFKQNSEFHLGYKPAITLARSSCLILFNHTLSEGIAVPFSQLHFALFVLSSIIRQGENRQ